MTSETFRQRPIQKSFLKRQNNYEKAVIHFSKMANRHLSVTYRRIHRKQH